MAQTKLGARKIAASKTGLSLEEYEAKLSSGMKWCSGGKHWCDNTSFNVDKYRYDGLASVCITCSSILAKKRHKPKGRVSKKGSRYATPRDGDRLQANGRINTLVNNGLIPRPDDLPCVDCGDFKSGRKHHYDHHMGYAVEFQEVVQPRCTKCHAARHSAANEAPRVKLIEHNGVVNSVSNWARKIGISHTTLRERLEKWGVARALETPRLRK